MEEKYRQTSERRIQNLLGFGIGTLIKKNSMCEIKAFPSITHIKEKPGRIKFCKKSALEIYLAEKILNDIRNLKDIYSIKYSYFNKLYFSNLWRITRHFKEISSEDDKQIFYQIMLLSRDSEEIIFASSNAATILNKIGFSFDDQNLQNIKIPYADLSNNSFIRTDFSNSDLRYVDFTSSFVALSNFSNCKMSESKLWKAIFEPKDRRLVEKLTISKCGKYIAWLDPMTQLEEGCFVSIFYVPQLVKKWNLPLSNSKCDISDLKFSLDSSLLYILYMFEDFLIWNFCENWHKVIKLEDKILYSGSAFSNTMLAYAVPDIIRFISLLTFQPLTQVKARCQVKTASQVKTGSQSYYNNMYGYYSLRSQIPSYSESQSYYQIKNINEKYLLCQKRNSEKYGDCRMYKIWTIDGSKSKIIIADDICFGNDAYIKTYDHTLEVVKMGSNDPIWKIRDANYLYKYTVSCISSDDKFLANSTEGGISIIDIQNQGFIKYYYNVDNLYCRGWLNLFKLGFLRLKHKAKALSSSSFSNTIEEWKSETDNLDMLFKENNIIIALPSLLEMINIETRAVKFINISNKCESMAFSNDIFILNFGPIIEIWSLQDQELVQKLQISERGKDMKMSIEKYQFSLISEQNSFLIYSIESGKIIHRIKYNGGYIACYKFTGEYLIFKTNNWIGVWDSKTDECKYIKVDFYVPKVIFSPCGRWALLHDSANQNGAIIFNINTGLYKPAEHGKKRFYQYFACFSPCGNYLATAGFYDIIIWESATGIKIAKTEGLKLKIEKICYSQCGKYIASYVEGNVIPIWNVEKDFKNYEKRSKTDLEFNLSLNKAILSHTTVFSKNNFSEVSYVDDEI